MVATLNNAAEYTNEQIVAACLAGKIPADVMAYLNRLAEANDQKRFEEIGRAVAVADMARKAKWTTQRHNVSECGRGAWGKIRRFAEYTFDVVKDENGDTVSVRCYFSIWRGVSEMSLENGWRWTRAAGNLDGARAKWAELKAGQFNKCVSEAPPEV